MFRSASWRAIWLEENLEGVAAFARIEEGQQIKDIRQTTSTTSAAGFPELARVISVLSGRNMEHG